MFKRVHHWNYWRPADAAIIKLLIRSTREGLDIGIATLFTLHCIYLDSLRSAFLYLIASKSASRDG
jgi:hypothetical protein